MDAPELRSRVRINDPGSRFHGQVGTVAAIYPQAPLSTHLVLFSDGWQAVFPPRCLAKVKGAVGAGE